MNAQYRYEYQHRQMGTQIRLILYVTDQLKADSISKAAFARIDELNNKLSDYQEDSELRKLCEISGYEVGVSDDLFSILRTSVQISSQTAGSFDVTAGPLIALWRKSHRTGFMPKSAEINEAKQKVGYQHIIFSKKNRVLLEKEGMVLDLGAIGKGFAADEVMKILKLAGIESAMVDMGGDILVTNPPPNKPYWTIAFSYFNKEGLEISQKLKLRNQAVATSGDAYQFVEIEGIRYSHIVDPKSGIAIKNGVQVTVIAPSATMADAYASAYSVMGIETAQINSTEIADLKVFMVENAKEYYNKWMNIGFADCMFN